MELKALNDNQLNNLKAKILRFKYTHMAFYNNHLNRCERIQSRIVNEQLERSLAFARRF